MMNMSLIISAVNLAMEYLEAEGIYESSNRLLERASAWYNNTEITDKEVLAAVVMLGDFEPGIKHDEIMAIKEYFFPSMPFELCEINIGEIEMALHDAEWR